jgi:two-component system cell cycle sensor histidine kinase/response regulator CckA
VRIVPRILVVDDSSQNRYLLEVLLKGSGYEVSVASNGAEALDSALANPPDLIISDLLMPVMDGFSLCRKWKSHEQLQTIPFVVYTATYTEPKDEELALSLGADRFVTKPQEPDVLIQIISDVLSGSRAGTTRKSGDVPHEEAVLLKKYSEALFHKLEKKMAELEAKNQSLERTIAERVRGEEALRASEAEYRIVAENTYNWEFWLNPDGGFRYISPSCKRITGHDCEEFLRDPQLLQRAIHPDDWPRFKAHVDSIEKLKGQGNLEFRILHADGSQRWIAHDCLPVFGESSLWLGTRGSNRDITEQKRLEAQLLHAQKMEAVGQLAGGIAHDFNNILTAIIGYTNILQMKTRDDDLLRGYLDQIAIAAERASNLTNSLLTFSRKQDVKLRSVNLNNLVRNVEKFLQRIIGEDIQIRTALTQEVITIYADSGQIEQVLMNLATNARDAMPAGGILTIETDVMEIDKLFIDLHGYGTSGRYAMLSVSDNGAGMDEKTRQKIFEPFFTTKETGKGTGLGLSIVYGIVKQHNGYINVYSEPGRGSTFRLLFQNIEPEPSSQEEREKEKGALGRQQRGSETILVVDDDAAIRHLFEICLTDLGYKVILAEDGQDAVQKFRAALRSIDLVVIDTVMPKKNGREASLEIRALRHDMKVLLMSGYSPDMVQGQGLLVEGAEFILKPLRPSEFVGRVRAILDRG